MVLRVHGLVHLMGVALLLQFAEPGDLSYADARPEVETTLAVVFALFWAVACSSEGWRPYRLSRPVSRAAATASALDVTPSFLKIDIAWVFTVCRDTNKRSPISGYVR